MKNSQGVTLIEILVAMSIMAIIMITLQMVFNVSLRAWRKSDNVLQSTSIARTVLERISREVSSAVIDSGGEFYCIGYDGPSGLRTDSVGDEFYFIAPLKVNNATGSDLCEVGYWLDGKGTVATSDDVLRRFYVLDNRGNSGTELDFNYSTGPGNANKELEEGITNLEFLYYDINGIEYTLWDSRIKGGAPAKIKVKITVAVGKGTLATNPDFHTETFSRFISLPN